MVSIAIDGTAGAGKSSIAKIIAKRLGFIYIDTGALYRAIAYYILKNKIMPKPNNIINKLNEIDLQLKIQNGAQKIFLSDEDVTDKLRAPEISKLSSSISKIKEVREFLLRFQRDVISWHNVVMDGRDIGTVIIPDADVKIFLTASAEARAKRRFDEFRAFGGAYEYEQVLKDVISRDESDYTREIAPLKQAKDAILVDTTNYSFEESVQLISEIIESKLNLK